MLSDLLLVVSCRECRQEMGQVNEQELKFLMQENEYGPVCFYCQPYSAMVSPEVYWQANNGDKIILGDTVFVWEDGLMKQSSRAREHAHDARALSCLSSSTYLNETPKNHVVFDDGREFSMCHFCLGSGINPAFDNPSECPECLGDGVKEVAIFLPAWLIGLEESHA